MALGPLTRVSPAVHPLLLHLVCLMVTVKTMEIPMRIPQSSIHLGCFKLGRVSCLSFQETEQRANKLQKYLLRTLCFQPFKGVFCFFFFYSLKSVEKEKEELCIFTAFDIFFSIVVIISSPRVCDYAIWVILHVKIKKKNHKIIFPAYKTI